MEVTFMVERHSSDASSDLVLNPSEAHPHVQRNVVRNVHLEWISTDPLSYWTVFLLGTLKQPHADAKGACPKTQMCVTFAHRIGTGPQDRAGETMTSVIDSVLAWVSKQFPLFQWESSFGFGNGYCSPMCCPHAHPTRFLVEVEQFDLPVPLKRTFQVTLPRDHCVGSVEFLWTLDLQMKTSWQFYVVRNICVLNSVFQ